MNYTALLPCSAMYDWSIAFLYTSTTVEIIIAGYLRIAVSKLYVLPNYCGDMTGYLKEDNPIGQMSVHFVRATSKSMTKVVGAGDQLGGLGSGACGRGWEDPGVVAVKDIDSDDENELNRLGKQVSAYLDGTSIHGLKYIGEQGRHWIERYVVLLQQQYLHPSLYSSE